MKIQLKSKLLGVLLVLAMLLTLGLGIGLQNSLVLKVYATEPDNALANIAASELQIVLHKNDHSTVNTTFAGGKYLHINGAYETLEINDSSAGADMEYDVSTGTLKLYDTDNMAEYEGKLSLYGLNESDKQLIIEDYYNGFTFYNLAFEKGNLTIENTSGNTNFVGSFGWKNKFKLNGELTIRGNTSVYLWLGATGYNYDVNNIIEVGTLKLLGNSSLRYTAEVSDDVYAIVSANSLVLDTDGELYLDAEDAGGLTRVLSTNDVTLTKCKKITLVAPDSYDTTLTNSTYLRNAVTTPIPGYYASITQYGDTYDGYRKTYRLISDSLYFSVSFDANGGSGTMAPVEDVQGYYILPGCTLVPPEYEYELEFQCWTDKSYGGSNYAEGDSFFLYSDVKFYAKWKIASDHIVSFDANGGSGSMTGGSYKGGYALPACSFTAPSGKQFKCWALGSASGMQFDTDATYYLYKDVTFYAIWEDIPTFIVAYGPGEGVGSTEYEYVTTGTTVTLLTPTDPYLGYEAPEGKKFAHWRVCKDNALDPNAVVKNPGDEITITFETYIIAVWEDIPAVPTGLTASYNGTILAGNKLAINQLTVKLQYSDSSEMPCAGLCEYWYNGSKIDDPINYVFGVELIGTITITVKYQGFETTFDVQVVGYEIIFNANTGSGTMESVEYVGAYTLPACTFTAPNGMQFKGWSTSASGEVIDGATYNVTANVELFAIWEDIPHNHVFGDWEVNQTHHWKECACGEEDEKAEHEDLDSDDLCDECGYDMTVEEESESESDSEIESESENESESQSSSQGGTTSESLSESQPKLEEPKDGLSGGAIAGIVVGSVAVVGVGGFAIFWFVIKKKSFADLIAIFKKK